MSRRRRRHHNVYQLPVGPDRRRQTPTPPTTAPACNIWLDGGLQAERILLALLVARARVRRNAQQIVSPAIRAGLHCLNTTPASALAQLESLTRTSVELARAA